MVRNEPVSVSCIGLFSHRPSSLTLLHRSAKGRQGNDRIASVSDFDRWKAEKAEISYVRNIEGARIGWNGATTRQSDPWKFRHRDHQLTEYTLSPHHLQRRRATLYDNWAFDAADSSSLAPLHQYSSSNWWIFEDYARYSLEAFEKAIQKANMSIIRNL